MPVAYLSLQTGEFARFYRFLKGFHGLTDNPTIFQQRIDKTLEVKHPAWLHDIKIVTKGGMKKHKIQAKSEEVRILQEGN